MATVTRRSYARVGLLGNPSDGYHGRTISVLIENYFAEVSTARQACRSHWASEVRSKSSMGNSARCPVAQVTLEPSDDGSVHFVPHWEHDAFDFASLAEFTRT
jgi:hypothetical protein